LDDSATTLAELRKQVAEFVEARDWSKFHAPKNIAMALAIEAAELMEHFQWMGVDESRDIRCDPQKREAVSEEIADVFCYTMALANELQIDLSTIFRAKMIKNTIKYPSAVYQGRYKVE